MTGRLEFSFQPPPLRFERFPTPRFISDFQRRSPSPMVLEPFPLFFAEGVGTCELISRKSLFHPLLDMREVFRAPLPGRKGAPSLRKIGAPPISISSLTLPFLLFRRIVAIGEVAPPVKTVFFLGHDGRGEFPLFFPLWMEGRVTDESRLLSLPPLSRQGEKLPSLSLPFLQVSQERREGRGFPYLPSPFPLGGKPSSLPPHVPSPFFFTLIPPFYHFYVVTPPFLSRSLPSLLILFFFTPSVLLPLRTPTSPP